MQNQDQIFNLINSSDFGIFTYDGLMQESKTIEIDRVVQKNNGNLILSLRARNASNKPVRIFSFLVSEFKIPKEIANGKVLENGWLQCSEILYKSLNEQTKMNTLFLQRDQNPFSFKKEYGYVDDSIISEWFTKIGLKDGTLFIGAVTTADMFSQIFIKKENSEIKIRVTCQYDGLILNPGQVVKSEKIFFTVDKDKIVEEKFANTLKKEMHAANPPEKINAMCCSYYWNGNKITDESIGRELTALENFPEKLNLDYFELDAGYTKFFGDWLDYKERFPGGFEGIIKRIKNLGYKPAIWLSPFAINPGTKLHDYHPSWFLKGRDHGHFDGRLTSPFDSMFNITDLEVLDPTKEEVKNYLKKILTHFKEAGFEMFKLDFMYPVCLSNNYSKSVTRVQALREGIKFIKEVLGPNVPIATCITQLSPLVGIVDFVRTGIDTLNPFVCAIPGVNKMVNDYMLESNLEESKHRAFFNGVIWRADPDMLIFRSGTGIDESLIEKHKEFARKNDMCLWVGDSVAQMDDKTKEKLLKFFNHD